MPGKGRPFPKGVSGNPGGRPKVLGDVQDLARQKSPEAINTLSNIMHDEKAPPAARVVLLPTLCSIAATANQPSQSRRHWPRLTRARSATRSWLRLLRLGRASMHKDIDPSDAAAELLKRRSIRCSLTAWARYKGFEPAPHHQLIIAQRCCGTRPRPLARDREGRFGARSAWTQGFSRDCAPVSRSGNTSS